MQYYRCRCGKAECYGSMGPTPCMGCDKCGTTLNQHPDFHKTPEPHSFVVTGVDTDEGVKDLTICKWCMKSKKELHEESNRNTGNSVSSNNLAVV